jgi:hypothetical protein
MQRYAYALKHGLKVNSDHKRSCIKFVRTLTDSREQKLKNINFIFVQPRDEGRNQARREQMLSRAMQYYDEHGNLTASAYVDQPLNSWLIQQCKKLQDDSQLSMRNKPLSLAGQAFVRFMIQFLVGCFKTFTYFCGKDNLDNRLKFINSVLFYFV